MSRFLGFCSQRRANITNQQCEECFLHQRRNELYRLRTECVDLHVSDGEPIQPAPLRDVVGVIEMASARADGLSMVLLGCCDIALTDDHRSPVACGRCAVAPQASTRLDERAGAAAALKIRSALMSMRRQAVSA